MIALMLLATTATVQVPAAPPAATPAAPPTMQALFDTASAAYVAQRWSEVLADFVLIETRLHGGGSARVRSTIMVRRGVALANLGRPDEAEAVLHSGLPLLPVDSDLNSERVEGHVTLARIASSRNDFATMRTEVEAADRVASTPQERLSIAIVGISATLFDADDAALTYADRAIALATATPDTDKREMANLETLRARVLMNRGDTKGAYALLKNALAKQGGLKERVSQADVRTRADLALAALMAKDDDHAREYMAWTGAGRSELPFGIATYMQPPPCGGAGDLKPDDIAVVQFGIGDNGLVGYATPVYLSRRSSAAAADFARAVRDWTWSPEAVKTLKPFFRAATRVELRCSTASERPSPRSVLDEAVNNWLDRFTGLPPFVDAAPGAWLLTLQSELARRDALHDDSITAPLLFEIINNASATPDIIESAMRRLVALPDYAKVPAAVRGNAVIRRAWVAARKDKQGGLERLLSSALADPVIAADTTTSAVLKLEIVDADHGKQLSADSIALLESVANDARLKTSDPLRVAALVRLAGARAAAGQIDAARATYEKTGLNAQSCALVDAEPVVTRNRIDSDAFPLDAQKWGFSGWVQLEYDIDAAGTVQRPRAIVAYPPFVFRNAAVGSITKLQYRQSYRPAGGLGCGGATRRIKFEMAKD